MGRLLRDRYELAEKLGSGGHGTVWRAFDHQHGRDVALKLRPVSSGADREGLLGEARTLLGLRPHAGLPVVRDDFFEGDCYALVMDWVAGPNLADVLAAQGDPGLPPSLVVGYLGELAAALDHLHAHHPPVVHGDVKPANVVVGPEGTVVLVDFGLVGAGVRAGTRGYRAPEVAAGGPATPAVDVYGLAATAVALLTGSAPVNGRPSWEGLDPAVVGALERGVRRGLASDPARRPASAGELAERLRAALGASLPVGVVTFLLTDIVGSTGLWDAYPETMGQVITQAETIVADAVESRGGRLIKARGEGDSTLSVFARASDAAAAALGVQLAVTSGDWPAGMEITLRVALHTGEAELREGDYYGGTLNRAARLRGLARGGQIVCSQASADLLADALSAGATLTRLGERALRGLSRAETVYTLDHPDLARPVPTTTSTTADVGSAPDGGRALLTRVELPSWLTPTGPATLAGRTSELAAIAAAVTDGREGRRRGLLVVGEPGMGKTRLVGEASGAARAGGVLVLAGRCDPDLASAYGPFADALRQVAATVPPATLGRALGRWPGELGRVVPELAELAPGLPPPLVSDPETERWRLFEAVASALGTLSEPAGLMLVVDDLQWATQPTVALLGHLLRSETPLRLTLVATCRDTEVDAHHPLAEALGALNRLPGVARLPLGGLDEAGMAELVASAVGHELSADGVALARLVGAATGGNPLFAGEVLRHLAETGALEQNEGRWTLAADPEELGLPEGVRDVIGLRLARLGDVANDVLRAGAVAGVDFDLAVAAALSGVDEEACLDALEAAASARLVVDLGADRWRFVHALVRATLCDALSPSRRARRHADLARLLEQAPAPDPVALAYHWERATGDESTRRAVGWLRRAGDAEMARVAPDQAALFYARGLGLDARLGDGGLEPPERIGLTIALGVARRLAGDAAHRQTLLDAAHDAAALGDAELLATAAVENTRGFWSIVGGVDQERIDVLEQALVALPVEDTPLRARLLAFLASELLFRPDRDRRFALADEALAVARRLGDEDTLIDVLVARAWSINTPTTLEGLWAEAGELRSLADRIVDPGRRVLVLTTWYLIASYASQLHDADEVLADANALATELGQPTLRWLTTSYLASRALLSGRLEQAEALATTAFAHGQEAGQPDHLTWYGGQLWELRYQQGRLGELVEIFAGQEAEHAAMPVWKSGLALVRVQAGHLDHAGAVFDGLAADGFAAIPLDHFWLMALAGAAEVCHALGRAAEAKTLHTLLAPWAHLAAGMGIASIGSLQRHLGILAATMGDRDRAETHLAAAVTENERLGSPVFAALARLDHAEMLLGQSEPGDVDRARRLVAEARGATAALGIGLVDQRAQRLEAALGHH